MCGIVGAIAERQITPILIEGLRRLEYRGYDSAGIAVISRSQHTMNTVKAVGKVQALADEVGTANVRGSLGIAHTRWATHGKPSQRNAHPHLSDDTIALVHNGIIENYLDHKQALIKRGYSFASDTDTEVIAHLIQAIQKEQKLGLVDAVKAAIKQLHGAYGIAVISKAEPDSIVVARSGSPLVIGIGIGENFIASDPAALGQVTDRFIYLEEGDIAHVTLTSYRIWNGDKDVTGERTVARIRSDNDDVMKGKYRHYMQKEIHEQPEVLHNTLQGRISKTQLLEEAFGVDAHDIFDKVKAVHIVACGTSSHAGMVARYWFEGIAKVPCTVEIASEYRYRSVLVPKDCLFVSISQSGETADTLAALRYAKKAGYVGCLTVCNVASSSLVRESDLAIMTYAGREIGVASTKAFTTQLSVLGLLVLAMARRNGMTPEQEKGYVADLNNLPAIVQKTLLLDDKIRELSYDFAEKSHSLFLGRGVQYPVAMEGALKLKEISYIHAEAYPAGELKHGPLALVDNEMPVIVVAPNNELLEKLKSNMQEVRARGGQLYVFADAEAGINNEADIKVVNVPHCSDFLAPIVYTVPLQLLSYHVAVIKGTDVDQPRNLAKSVTVE